MCRTLGLDLACPAKTHGPGLGNWFIPGWTAVVRRIIDSDGKLAQWLPAEAGLTTRFGEEIGHSAMLTGAL